MLIKMEVDKIFAGIGDELNYIISIHNTEATPIYDVHMIDTLPMELEWIENSICVEDEQITSSPTGDIRIGDILAQDIKKLTFKCRVKELPQINPIVHIADISFKLVKEGEIEVKSSNTHLIVVNDPNIRPNEGFKLNLDKQITNQGSTIKCEVTLKNNGNTLAENLQLMQIEPEGTQLIVETLEGASKQNFNNGKWKIGNLDIGESKTLRYELKIQGNTESYELINEVILEYVFTLPDRSRAKRTYCSNKENIKICVATFSKEGEGFTKKVSKEECTLDEELTYTIQLTNQGNAPALNVYLKDEIPKGTKFVSGSLRIGNQYYTTPIWPKEGIKLEDIQPMESIEVAYSVQVGKELLEENTLSTQAIVDYTYAVAEETFENQQISSTAKTKIGAAIIDENSFEIFSDTIEATVGDQIPYTMRFKNKGNLIAKDVKIKINFPEGAKILEPEWKIQNQEAHLDYGIGLIPGQIYEINFVLQIEELPQLERMNVVGTIEYSYELGDTKSRQVITRENRETIPIKVANIPVGKGLIKMVDKKHAKIGEIITYSIVLQNQGNIKASNVWLKEEIPEEILLEESSLFIDDECIEQDLTAPIKVGDLEVESVKVITYKVRVMKIPEEGKIQPTSWLKYEYEVQGIKSRESYHEGIVTQLYSVSIDAKEGGIIKQADQECVTIGDKINYTIILTNTGNTVAERVALKPNVNQSISVAMGEEFIEIGSIKPRESQIITYDVLVEELPEQGQIGSQDEVKYCFQVGEQIVEGYGKSREVIVDVEAAVIQKENMPLVQEVDKEVVKIGDVLTYTLRVKNEGNIAAENIQLILPEIEGGRWINQVEKKILRPHENEVYEYRLEIESLPRSGKIICAPYIIYEYRLSNNRKCFRQENIQSIETEVKHVQLEGLEEKVFLVTPQYVTVGEVISYTLDIVNKGNVKAEDIKIIPQLIEEVKLLKATLWINQKKLEGEEIGLYLQQLAPGENMKIQYTLNIEVIPETNPISMPVCIEYSYEITEDTRQMEQIEFSSQPVYVQVADLEIEKKIDQIEVTYGDKIIYEIVCKNKGNIEAEDIIIQEQFPRGMRLEKNRYFNNDSIKIESIQPGETKNIKFEVQIDNYAEEGLSDCTQLSYKMQVDPNQEKRLVQIHPIKTNFELKRVEVLTTLLSETDTVIVGEVIPYKYKVENKGNIPIEQLKIKSMWPDEISVVAQSLRINGEEYKALNEEIIYPMLGCNEKIEIEIEIKINKRGLASPIFGEIQTEYYYQLRERLYEGKGKVQVIPFKIEEIKLDLEKHSDKEGSPIRIGDEINYRIQLTNIGTIGVEQSVLFDKLPAGVSLIGESIQIGKQILRGNSLGEGVNLGKIDPGEVLLVTYKVKVEKHYGKVLNNQAYVEYMIRRNDNLPLLKKQTPVQMHTLKLAVLEQTNVLYTDRLTLPYQYPDLYEIIDTEVKMSVIQTAMLPNNNQQMQIRGQIQYKLWYRGKDKQIHTMAWVKLLTEKLQLMMAIEEDIVLATEVAEHRADIINSREVATRVQIQLNEK